MSLPTPTGYYTAEAKYAPLLRELGLADAMSVFEHPKIDCWRSITERENCVLDHDNGRLHVKRNKPGHRGVDAEAAAIRLLMNANLPTVPLVAAGRLNDGRGFLITDDLTGYDDADVRLKNGLAFDALLGPTADLAGRLHAAGLHHRDLYLCHFYVSLPVGATHASPADAEQVAEGDAGVAPTADARLMDAGRVRPLPRWFRRRWLVKDVAQFVYSVRQSGVAEAQIEEWLQRYAFVSGTVLNNGFRSAVERKVRWIGRHDEALRRRDPTRNVGIDKVRP